MDGNEEETFIKYHQDRALRETDDETNSRYSSTTQATTGKGEHQSGNNRVTTTGFCNINTGGSRTKQCLVDRKQQEYDE